MRMDSGPLAGHACACANGRRDFLRQAAALLAGLAAGGAGLAAAGLPVRFGDATSKAGDELTFPIPDSDGAVIDRANAVSVVRFQGKAIVFNLSCPHQNAAVRWKPTEGHFECTKHDSVYSQAGVYQAGRATRNMDRFPVKRSGHSIIANVAQLIQSDEQKAAWEAAFIPV